MAGTPSERWNFGANPAVDGGGAISIRRFIEDLRTNLDGDDGGGRAVIPLSHGDPSPFPGFRTDPSAVDAVCDTLRSANFNSYSTSTGLLVARKAVAEYAARGLSCKVSPDNVYLTAGCNHGIEILMSVLAYPGANILLPRPGYPLYDSRAYLSRLEVRYFDLIPENAWEFDLDAIETLADDKTVAIVVINPGNPCGNVLSRQYLQKIAEMARRLRILVIADEVYESLVFGSNPFVSMAEFADIAPVIKLGGISKAWFVPGWRVGWMVAFDPRHVMKHSGLLGSLDNFLSMTTESATFIQGAIPDILGNTKEDFFLSKVDMVRESAEICYEEIKKIPCLTCPFKPEGSMFVMAKLDLSQLQDIVDDMDFCNKLAREESVLILPGRALGMKKWVRITFAVDLESLREGLERLRSFVQRHTRKQ